MCPMNGLESEEFNPETFDWQNAKDIGFYNHCILKSPRPPTCGKLLSHCRVKVTSFRERVGIRICIFKIGVSSNPIKRYQLYREQGFTSTWILATCDTVDLVHMLEAALIVEFHKHVGCRNMEGTGGDGALNRNPPSPPPYFCYVTGGRADQKRRVG